jgi:hypothetical protein
MRFEEILRALADTIEQHGTGEDTTVQPEAAVVVEPEVEREVNSSGKAEQPDDIMIPPLQLKIELLKKAVDVDSIYDHTEELDAEGVEQEMPAPVQEDEIVALRRAAGLNPAVIQELANDEPLDD